MTITFIDSGVLVTASRGVEDLIVTQGQIGLVRSKKEQSSVWGKV